MNLDLTAEELAFRDEASTWLRENLPTEPRPPEGQEMREFDLAWQRTLFDGGDGTWSASGSAGADVNQVSCEATLDD